MHDAHIHIAMSPLKENLMGDIYDFINKGGKKILAQTTDISNYTETLELVNQINQIYPNTVDFALGIHPTLFGEAIEKNALKDLDLYIYAKKQMKHFEDIFNKNREKIKAIGEVGIDYFEMNTYFNIEDTLKQQLTEIQKNTFRTITKLAVKYNLPMSIHSRDLQGDSTSTHDILTILTQEGRGIARGVFHSYTGELELINTILDMGFYIGFNAIITYPNGENVREILRKVPVEKIIFETDGPFLPTQSIRKNKKENKKYGRPILIKEIIEYAAEIKDIPSKKLENITDSNYTTLFGN